MTLDFDPDRPPPPARPAATLILLRDRRDPLRDPLRDDERDDKRDLEVAVMQRSLQSKFMGGAVVFPGGRVEPHDARGEWPAALTTHAGESSEPWWDDEGFAARVAACREALEEVAMVPLTGGAITSEALEGLRRAIAEGVAPFREALRAEGRALDLDALVPFSRWVTPEAEQRRFDARFFVARAPEGQEGAIDRREAIRTFFATPRALLDDYERGAIALFPPTHRTLVRLSTVRSVDDALSLARRASLDVICPRFALDDGVPTLALPGDRLHAIAEPRIEGASRYVLRGDRWVEEDAPRASI